MIHFVKGNLFDSKAEALVNAVNTVGVMGKGIALEFKNRFPHNFTVYKEACEKGNLKTGFVLPVAENDGRIILNFPTKAHWKDASKYEYIETGLKSLKEQIKIYGLKSVAIPPLGCGLGGLEWAKVRRMIENELSSVNIQIYVYEP